MSKRRDDYRLLRSGRGLEKVSGEILGRFQKVCRFCSVKSWHNKTKRLAETGQWVYSLQCDNCGEKSFGGKVDSQRDTLSAVKGELIKGFRKHLWDWVRDNIEEVVQIEFPDKINIFKGKIGTPRRHKGKPVYSSNDFHPDFLRYLGTPEYIKRLKEALRDLESINSKLFDFFFFRAAGYSFKEMHDSDHFGPLVKFNTGAQAIKSGPYEPNGHCKTLAQQVDFFLIRSIPEDLLGTFEGGRLAVDMILSSTALKDSVNNERVICPKCNASDPECSLCRSRKRQWDGTIPRKLLDFYQKKIARGEEWTDDK